jgi:xylulokinase
MSAGTILAIDVGTTSIKAALIDGEGSLRWSDRERIGHHIAEVDSFEARFWLDALGRLLSRREAASGSQRIAGIVISGHGPTLVPIDAEGSELTPVLLWLDGREERLDGQSSFFLPKVAWLKRRHPSVYRRAALFLSCPEYLSYALSGSAATVTPSEEFTPYIWTDASIRAYGLAPEKFPPFVTPSERIGWVTPDAASMYELPAGVPVYAGGSDFLMSLLGTGAVEPGTTSDRAGTSEGINYCAETPVADQRLRVLPHIIAGRYNVAGILSSTGTIFEWYRNMSGQTRRGYDEMLRDIDAVPMDRHIPWFFPSIHQGGAWEFSRGMFIELGSSHGSAEMGRAVVESIGYAVREAIDMLEESGCRIESLRACGGQARNETWNQMKADIVGKPIDVGAIIDAELLGGACCGMVGEGWYGSLAEASASLYRNVRRYEPDEERHRHFQRRYRRYGEAYGRFRRALADCGVL